MTPQELKNSILQLAIQGRLVEQRPEEGTAEELYKQIQAEKQRLIKEGKIKKEKPLPEITEDEKPFEIPEGWMWVRLGKLIRVIGGISYNKNDVCGTGLRILRGGNIQNLQVNLEEDDVFLPTEYSDAEKQVCIGDCIIVASTGSKAVIGKAGYIDRDIPGTMIGAFLRICRPYMIDCAEYVRCIFDSDFYRKHIRELSQGTNINNVKESYITEMMVPLPPLAEQKRIVAKIEELLPLIDRYEQAWTKLEDFNKRFPVDMQKSILQMAIQGKLVEQRPEEGTGEELYQQIQAEKQRLIKEGKLKKEKPLPEITEDEVPFEIPENWKWVRLSSIGVTQTGNTPPKAHPEYIGSHVPFITPGDILNGNICYNNQALSFEGMAVARVCSAGAVLQVCIGGSIGKAAISDREVAFNQQINAVMPILVESNYIYAIMTSAYFTTLMKEKASGTATPIINRGLWDSLLIPIPPFAEQKRIVAKLEELLPLCEQLKWAIVVD